MSFSKSPTLSIFLLIFLFTSTRAANFLIQNNCPYTVWPASVTVGGGQISIGDSMYLSIPSGTTLARIWGRTSCNFDSNGTGHCQTGDCNGLLQCVSSGAPPQTLVEYALTQYNDLDFFDISLVDGFNVPIEFSPMSTKCNRSIKCNANIIEECPIVLKAPGGCNNACAVFNTDQYCCPSKENCGPTDFSRFFKERCPDAYSYPYDDQTSTFTCPSGSNYKVVFCPGERDTSIESKMQLYLVCGI